MPARFDIHNPLQVLVWLVALLWLGKLAAALRGLPTIPNLLTARYDLPAEATLTVIVPARNESADIAACLQSLLDQDTPIHILAVDDRSTDATGQIMDALADVHPERLRVLHIADLPPGWLGKTHAMARAAELVQAEVPTDFLLFTDADIFFAPDSLRRALVCAVQFQTDHLILLPTAISRRWDEAALLSFFQVLGLFAAPVWRVANPRSRHALGVGAFNLVRRSAYEQSGGFRALRLEVVEDLALGRLLKSLGFKPRVAFGRNLVRLHWAAGVQGIIHVMTKNMFSAFRFSPPLVFLGCAWLALVVILPPAALFHHSTLVPAAVSCAAIVTLYRLMAPHSGLRTWNALLAPLAAAAFMYASLVSMFTTLRQGGIVWRGTFYSLAELKAASKRKSIP